MNTVKTLRLQSGITQARLAHQAGTSQPTIAAYEAGEKSPTLATLNKLAQAAGFEVAVSFVPPLTREDRRSLAYHAALVAKLRADPKGVLARAKHNLDFMAKKHVHARLLFDRWRTWLSLPTNELAVNCLDRSLIARDMRQVSPFAGVLSAQERLEILKRFREEERA